MSLRQDLLAAKTHAARGAMRATATAMALQVQVDQAGPNGLLVTRGERSAVIYGLEVQGNAVRVYLDAAHSDAATLVIINPPTLVADPAGDIDLPQGKYREDPAQAIIDVICGQYGRAPANPNRVIPARRKGA